MSFLSLTSSPCQTQFAFSIEDSYENNIENVPLSFLQRKSTVNHFTFNKETDPEITLPKQTVTRIKKPLNEIKVDDLKNRRNQINNEQNVFKFQNLSFADILNNSIKEKKQCDKEERESRKLNKIKQMKRQRILYNYNTYTNNSNTIMTLD